MLKKSVLKKAMVGATFVSIVPCATQTFAVGWDIEPSFKIGSTYSDNIDLVPNGDSDLATEVTPAVRVTRDSQYLQLELNYAIQNLFFYEDSGRNISNHRLRADVNAEAIPNTLFVDVYGAISQQLVDRKQSASSDSVSGGGNLSDVYAYSMSPYWQQRIGNVAETELRYTFDMVDSEQSGNDSTGNGVSFDATNGSASGKLYWNAGYDKQRIEYDDGNLSDTEYGTALIGHQIMRTLSLLVSGTYEKNEFIGDRGDFRPDDSYVGTGFTWSPSTDFSWTLLYNERLDPRPDEDKNFWSSNVSWAPSQRTDINVGYGNSFFGETYNGNLTHRTRWTRWSLAYDEGTSDFRSMFLEEGRFGFVCPVGSNVGCRIADADQPIQPDEELVGAEPGVTPSINDDTFINKRTRATVSVIGTRNTVTLTLNNSERTFVADNQNESDQSVDLSWLYQLAPRTESEISVRHMHQEFDDSEEDDSMRYAWGITRLVGSDSVFYVETQYTDRDSSSAARTYDESRVTVSFQKFF